MSLRDWLSNGWLTEHETTRDEMAAFLSLADRDIHDAKTRDLSTDWEFNIAYNAALHVALAALAAIGYRPARGSSHHYYAIQSLAFTLGTPAETVRMLDRFRKKRNTAEYDQVGAVSEKEAREMLEWAEMLRKEARAWLAKSHPKLSP
jgi:uncharacterized protein (UPF0332 family)